MRKIHLTTETKLALESRHRKCSDKRESDRIKAVLLCSKGWSAAMIAEALLLHETSILRHVDYWLCSIGLLAQITLLFKPFIHKA